MKGVLAGLAAALLVTGCATAPSTRRDPALRDTHEVLHGALWYQTSPEFYIASSTAFALARTQFDIALADRTWTAVKEQEGQAFSHLPPAVVLDIDETVLDNSPFQARVAADRTTYSHPIFDCWVERKSAEAMPGAKRFLDHVVAHGAEVIYITNRTGAQEKATVENLRYAGLPTPKGGDSVFSKGERPGWISDKRSRRTEIGRSYRILLLIGDDLADFVAGTRTPPHERRRLAETHAGYWGTKWILLPNPIYGSWEQSLYDFDFELSDNEVLDRKFRALKPFDSGSCKAR